MTETSNNFHLPSNNSPASSPNTHQTVISNQQDGHTLHITQQQQPQQTGLKSDLEYEYMDENGATIVAHGYTATNSTSRNHIKNDDDHQESTNTSDQGNGNIYHHISDSGIINSSNATGARIINETTTRRNIVNNNTIQRQVSPRNQTHNIRSSSPARWNQSVHSQQQSIEPHHPQQSSNQQQVPTNAFGMLRHINDILYITENCVEIGRNSSTSSVHFHVAKNSFVSRKHFQIVYDYATGDFYLVCLSKNGIFVDDTFQRRSSEAIKLQKSCTFRFPSTDIRIAFESFTDKLQNNVKIVENSNVIYSPLKITIPKNEQKSPYPSPTGTISAANSCPTSPRQGFQDYHAYNYNNNNNFQNQELFQPPSTSSYNEHEKPPYSYAQLIVQSISASPDKQLTLSGIYSFISKNYPYYRKEANKGWQNSIRHNLSLNRYFIKVARSQDEPGKGSFWRIDPNSEAKLIDQSYKKRRQRGSQCFRPPYGMPRSAPVSPSHIDNSRENSPLHDIVLQSAPGSPGVSYQNNHGDNNHAGNDDTNNYGSQNVLQQPYNSHNQFNNSSTAYYSGSNMSSGSPSINTTSAIAANVSGTGNGGNGTNSTGPIGPLKRHQPSSGITTGNTGGNNNSAIITSTSGGSSSHSTNIYEEITEYGTGAESDECETIKRQKYTTEINQ